VNQVGTFRYPKRLSISSCDSFASLLAPSVTSGTPPLGILPSATRSDCLGSTFRNPSREKILNHDLVSKYRPWHCSRSNLHRVLTVTYFDSIGIPDSHDLNFANRPVRTRMPGCRSLMRQMFGIPL